MTQDVADNLPHTDVLQMTTQVVAAYVGHNAVGEAQISDVIKSVYASLAGLNGHSELTAKAKQKPAVSIKKSITADHLICLEDGKKLKMLKRHLRTSYGLSPEDYRAKWAWVLHIRDGGIEFWDAYEDTQAFEHCMPWK